MKKQPGSLANVLTRSRALRTLVLLSFIGVPAIAHADVATEHSAFISVDASETSVDELLGQISANYGFVVERSGPNNDALKLTGHYEGSVAEVVNRILEDENHLIRYAKDKPNRIAKIILMGQAARRSPTTTAPYGTVASAPVAVPSPNVAEAASSPAVVVPQPATTPPAVVSRIADRSLLQKASVKFRPRLTTRSRRGLRTQN